MRTRCLLGGGHGKGGEWVSEGRGGKRGAEEAHLGGRPAVGGTGSSRARVSRLEATEEGGQDQGTFVMNLILRGSKGYRSGATMSTSKRPPWYEVPWGPLNVPIKWSTESPTGCTSMSSCRVGGFQGERGEGERGPKESGGQRGGEERTSLWHSWSSLARRFARAGCGAMAGEG